MTKTVTLLGRGPVVNGNDKTRKATLDITSYTASGEAVTAANFGLKRLDDLDIEDKVSDQGWSWRYDRANDLVRAYRASAMGGHVTKIYPNILGASDADQATDNGTAAVNGGNALSLRTAQDETVASGSLTDPDFARNVVVQLKASGGAGTLPTVGTVTVNGTDQFGDTVQEVYNIAPDEDFGAQTVAENNHRWKVGSKVFATLTSVGCDVDGNEANLQYSVGIGTKLAVESRILASGDVKAVQKNSASVASGTYTVNTTNHTVQMGADLADDDEVYIHVESGPTPDAGEAASGTDVGACRVTAIGR